MAAAPSWRDLKGSLGESREDIGNVGQGRYKKAGRGTVGRSRPKSVDGDGRGRLCALAKGVDREGQDGWDGRESAELAGMEQWTYE
jgi:hypothetical protein